MNRKEGPFTDEDALTLAALGGQAVIVLHNVQEREALLRANAQHEGQARQGCRIIGDSPALQALRATVERVARTDLPVLILGESGTGKEVVARAIHYSGPRHAQPFLPVNCAAIAETLLESELFGHEKGAFTDAHTTRAGQFEMASGGTLFLDEIGDMSASGQAKLLRVLEDRSVVRVGGSRPIPVDVRIVAATNRQLAEAVHAGRFRQDLFYRLNVVAIDLPPLRQRREDILPLAEFFLQQFGRDAGRPRLTLSTEARQRLRDHDWPGNVRELRNLMERIAFLSPTDSVPAGDLVFILGPKVQGASESLAHVEPGRGHANLRETAHRSGHRTIGTEYDGSGPTPRGASDQSVSQDENAGNGTTMTPGAENPVTNPCAVDSPSLSFHNIHH